ncbi:hypothetical protein [Parapedobacter koreensis]|uniref:DUF3888 domain-containing protein n=1 Tax=Parapedobacter koreensis TaxID=332977 RepID=A0A1H7IJV4_9SPHI|nr:hypothetical protein [Parapedobacter koreensis]SEK62823.1 hypothetical protein SAMN05421740_102268 [Parapedobacter koreensis]
MKKSVFLLITILGMASISLAKSEEMKPLHKTVDLQQQAFLMHRIIVDAISIEVYYRVAGGEVTSFYFEVLSADPDDYVVNYNVSFGWNQSGTIVTMTGFITVGNVGATYYFDEYELTPM